MEPVGRKQKIVQRKGLQQMNNIEIMNSNGTNTEDQVKGMTLETFGKMLIKVISPCLKDNGIEAVEFTKVTKNNSSVFCGLIFHLEGSNIAPTLYLEKFYADYKSGRSISDIADAVVNICREQHIPSGFDTGSITDYNQVKERICFKIVNTELNQDLLQDTPHVPFLDLSVIFYILLDGDAVPNGMITINNSLMNAWGVETDALYKKAIHNTQRLLQGTVIPIKEVLSELNNHGQACFPDAGDGFPCPSNNRIPMYVITNTQKLYGAAVFLDEALLSGFAESIGGDFYILPSSIHELILLPSKEASMDVEEMRQMVSVINATQLAPEDVLSDHIYYYNRATKLVEIV